MITRCPQSLGCRATGKSSSHLRHSPVVSLSRFCSTPSRWACARTRDGHRRRTLDEWRAGLVQTVAARAAGVSARRSAAHQSLT